VNPDRIDIQLPSPVCNPTIAKDPKRTPARVSLSLSPPGAAEKLPIEIKYCD